VYVSAQRERVSQCVRLRVPDCNPVYAWQVRVRVVRLYLYVCIECMTYHQRHVVVIAEGRGVVNHDGAPRLGQLLAVLQGEGARDSCRRTPTQIVQNNGEQAI
jgi:hypothetical protein